MLSKLSRSFVVWAIISCILFQGDRGPTTRFLKWKGISCFAEDAGLVCQA